MTMHQTDLLTDRMLEVETPERVAINYELAGLGSRFTALLLDMLLIMAGAISIVLVGVFTVMGTGGTGATVVWAVIIVLGFVWLWGYFIYFETRHDGQTPGKRKLRIRVVHEGGYPVSIKGAVIRNLLRIADMQPGFTWLLGGTVMLFDSRTRRLGDLAAGTVVVAERRAARLPEEVPPPGEAGPPRLDDREFATLTAYIARREVLEGPARDTVAARLAAQMEKKVPREPPGLRPGTYLLNLYADEQVRRMAAGLGGQAGSAQATALVRRQRKRWDEYRKMLDELGGQTVSRMGEEEVSRFAALYREVAADLARARTYGASPALIYSLERMVGAGHNLLYRRRGGETWRSLVRFLTGGFPALVRRRWVPIAMASMLLFGPGLITYMAILLDPGLAREILDPGWIAHAETAAQREAAGAGYANVPPVMMPVFASSVITNNVQVTFVAFAGGILAGLGTVAVLIFNGVHVGGVAAAFALEGQHLHLWSFVLPHGVLEIPAIAIAGGAGLLLGSALVMPGRRTRREALVRRGREAVSLIGGTAVLLVVAGLIEGFISPSMQIPTGMKLMLAALFGGCLTLYLLGAGRDETSRRQAAEAGALDADREGAGGPDAGATTSPTVPAVATAARQAARV